jgi:iron complex transport system substrate-binding protein
VRVALVLALAAMVAAPAEAAPRRIMSVNLCADLLLVQLVPRARIVSVSHLAAQAAPVVGRALVEGLPVNRGRAEAVAMQRPDLILAGPIAARGLRQVAAAIGADVLEVPAANSFDDIRRNVRAVGAAVGAPAGAEALVARMDARLARLAAERPLKARRIAAWSGGNSVPGRHTLHDAIFTAAGAVNIAAPLGEARAGAVSVESLLTLRPEALAAPAGAGPSIRAAEAAHPLVERLYRGRRIGYDDTLFACGLPQSVDAAAALSAALRAIPQGAPL